MHQIEMVSLNDLIPAKHKYHQFIRFWFFGSVSKQFKKITLTRMLDSYAYSSICFLQFMENLSDQKLESCVHENNAAKSFGEVLANSGLLSVRPKMKA